MRIDHKVESMEIDNIADGLKLCLEKMKHSERDRTIEVVSASVNSFSIKYPRFSENDTFGGQIGDTVKFKNGEETIDCIINGIEGDPDNFIISFGDIRSIEEPEETKFLKEIEGGKEH